MLGLNPFEFRFRGKSRLLLDIYYCFIEQGSPALHPTQIAKHTGISFAEVARRLARDAQTLWQGARLARKLDNEQLVAQLGGQLRERFSRSPELAAFEKGAWDE